MRRLLIAAPVFAILFGCGSAEPPLPKPKPGAVTTQADRDTHNQVKAGAFQIALVRDSIAEALQHAQKLPKSLGEGRDAILETLDVLGQDLGKHSDEPPPFAEFAKDLPGHRKRRVEAITLSRDAIHDLNDLRGEILALTELSTDAKLRRQFETLDVLVEDAIETLLTAINAFGEAPDLEEQI